MLLLRCGADPNLGTASWADDMKCSEGHTPLAMAASLGKPLILQLLLLEEESKAGGKADINQCNPTTGATAYHCAWLA